MMKKIKPILLLAWLLFVSGCKTAPLIAPTQDLSSKAKEVSEIPIEEAVLIVGDGVAASFAALGVMSELERKEIPISKIYAYGMGVGVSALYADSGSLNLAQFRWYQLKEKDLLDPTLLPRPQSLAQGKKLGDFLRNNLKAKNFSDLKIPLHVVVSRLPEGRREILFQGELLSALLASYSLPGVFPAVNRNGRLYVHPYFGKESVELPSLSPHTLVVVVAPEERYQQFVFSNTAHTWSAILKKMASLPVVRFNHERSLSLTNPIVLLHPYDLSSRGEWLEMGSLLMRSLETTSKISN